jgi:hypothetical protein
MLLLIMLIQIPGWVCNPNAIHNVVVADCEEDAKPTSVTLRTPRLKYGRCSAIVVMLTPVPGRTKISVK